MTNRYRGEIAVPEIGDGYTMRCDMEALARMETALVSSFEEMARFHVKVSVGAEACLPSILRLFLDNAVWLDGKRIKAAWPDDEPMEKLGQYCLDAFAVAMRGKTVAELRAEIEAKAAANENPMKGMAA